jgi:hydrogenase-4 component B
LTSVAGALPALIGLLLGVSALAAVVPGGEPARRAAYLAAALASAAMALLGVLVIAGAAPVAFSLGTVLGFALVDVRLDSLGAVFVLMLGVVGAMASVYAIGYVPHDAADHEGLPPRWADPVLLAYPLFLGSLFLVFGAADLIAFLVAWEGMAVASAVLVIGGRPSPGQARAGYIYLVLTHLATAAIIVSFAVLASGGSTAVADLPAAAASLDGTTRNLLFVLLAAGFATKAGAVPLHVWLPRAHPVAPSPVSALMSGVMVKAGIYGIARFIVLGLGSGPEWWGLVVIGVGAASAVLGVLYALMEHDLKRLLAFSTIENVGIVLIGLGAAMLAASAGLPSLAALALAAALVHALNHAAIKGLLFLAAGAVQQAAGTRDLNRLGGLARAMPITTLAFGLGAAAIAGIPPLGGFAGEWLTFGALFGVAGSPEASALARSAVLLSAGGLALAAALALAAFVKATGTGFLALPRSEEAAMAREAGRPMVGAMAALTGVCLAAGLGAGAVASAILGVADPLFGVTDRPAAAAGALAGPAGAGYGPLPLALVLALVFGGAALAGRRGAARRAPTWTCGILPEPAFEYTSTSYGKLLRLYFGRVLRPQREVQVELHPGTPFPRTIRYSGAARHVIDERVYAPLPRGAVAAAQAARRVQNGSLQLYLAYTVIALVILLLVARP